MYFKIAQVTGLCHQEEANMICCNAEYHCVACLLLQLKDSFCDVLWSFLAWKVLIDEQGMAAVKDGFDLI